MDCSVALREKPAKACVVPCEWPTYEMVSTPVWPRMNSTLAGRSYSAIWSHVKSQKPLGGFVGVL